MPDHRTGREISRLRYEARLAWLDGRNKRAKDLNVQADKLENEARLVSGPTVGEYLKDWAEGAR